MIYYELSEEEMFELRASDVLSGLGRVHVSYFIDRFTWERVVPAFVLKAVTADLSYLEGYEAAVFLGVYALLSYLLGRVLAAVWLPLTYSLWVASLVYSYTGGDTCTYGLIHALLLLREVTGGWRTTDGKVNSVYPSAYYQPPVRDLNGGMRTGLVVLTIASAAIVASIFVAEGDRHVMAALGMVLFFVAFVVLMPNAGGNSIWANLPYLMYFALILLFLPAVKDLLDTPMVLIQPAEAKNDLTRAVTLGAWDGLKAVLGRFDFTQIYVSVEGPYATLRLFMAMTYFIMIFVDKMFGPGYFLQGTELKDRKGDVKEDFKFSGAYSDPWVIVLIVGVILDYVTGFWMRIYAIAGALFAGSFLFRTVMVRAWRTKGSQASVKWLRVNTVYPTGDSVAGLRLLIGKVVVILMNLAWAGEHGLNIIPIAGVVSTLVCATNPRMVVAMIAHMGGIWWMLLFSVFTPDSLVSDLLNGAVGVTPAIDGNAGNNEALVGGNSSDGPTSRGITYTRRKLRLLGACKMYSDVLEDDMTHVRDWASKTGGTYEIRSDCEECESEVVFVTDDGARYLRHGG
uniref:Uncharacterized protein n=1 Tax=Soybean thrips virus 4 TaxID=2796558 RepID=A0A7T3R0P8_9VIRU|nr:hypothetical protein [Soybean thrips virus 4]